jgi:hypothetical protein
VTLDPKSLAVWVKGSRATELTAREIEATFPSHNDVGTYPGHGEIYSITRGTLGGSNVGQYAIDRMTASANTAAGRAEGDRIAGWVISNANRLGVRYVIWNRRIWSRTGPTPGQWRTYTNPVASRRGTPSGDHTNHVHVSRFCDEPYAPAGVPIPSTPSAPVGTVPASTPGRKPFPMADSTDVSFSGQLAQPLTPGENVVWLGPVAADGLNPLSVLTRLSEGVDLTATLVVRHADGSRATLDAVQATWRTVGYAKGQKPVTVSDTLSARGDQVRFAGPFNATPAKGKSNRLRLVLLVPEGATDLILQAFRIEGWAL